MAGNVTIIISTRGELERESKGAESDKKSSLCTKHEQESKWPQNSYYNHIKFFETCDIVDLTLATLPIRRAT